MTVFAFDHFSHTIVISHVIFIVVEILNLFLLRRFLLICSGSLSFDFVSFRLCNLSRFFLLSIRIESSFSSVWIYDNSVRFLLFPNWRSLFMLFLPLILLFRTRVITWRRTLFIEFLRILFLVICVDNILVLNIALENISLNLTFLQSWLLEKFS